jgi:hypothetical protein
MNKFIFDNLSSRFGLVSLGSMALWISPILTFHAFAGIEISIDPYNDSGFNDTPVMTQPQPIRDNSTSSMTNSPQLPTGNQNNTIGEIFINGNPTPPRLEVVSGNVIKSNQSLPQIPTVSEPYRNPNSLPNMTSDEDETIQGNNRVLSVSSMSDFDKIPRDNSSTVDKKPVDNSNTIRSIDVSPNSSSSPTENNLSSITTAPNLPKRRNLTDILVLSNPATNPINPVSNSVSPVASASSMGNVYKVLVGVDNQNQESLVKSLYPEAFRTVFNGQYMLQVGVFSAVNNANDVARSLQSKGLKTEITN